MTKRTLLIIARLALGSLTLAAIISQALFLQQQGVFNPVNYLSYFTNLSNIVAGVIMIISAFYLMKSRLPSPTDDLIRGAATLYMAVTGAVYITLLSGEDLGLLMPWVNIVTHIIMPVAVIADWLYQPSKSKLQAQKALVWLAFPAVYLVYSLIRGAATGWYAYPFLNPDKVGGYGGVAIYCVVILIAFFALGWLLLKLGNKLKRHI